MPLRRVLATDLRASNRNIFFVDGAYQAKELRSDPHQRFRLLTKLFENVTPIETTVAVRIAARFICIYSGNAAWRGDHKEFGRSVTE
jgi:hypothetical protein